MAARGGKVTLWPSARADDTPARLIQALTHGFRDAACRPAFGHAILAGLNTALADGLGALTCWLAAVTETAMEAVLIIDEADRLAGPAQAALEYLPHKLPANLRVALALRADHAIDSAGLVAYGQCALLRAGDVSFGLDETIEFLRARTSPAPDHETAARLHALTEGWPLGVQLVQHLLDRGADPAAAALLEGGGVERQTLLAQMLGHLDPADERLLGQLSVLEEVTPALAVAMTGDPGAAAQLSRQAVQTPLVMAQERGDWLRLQGLARDALRQRFDDLPETARHGLHRNAARWLADHGMLAQAARHALAAGDADWASAMAERTVYNSVMQRGLLTEAEPWLNLMPAEQADARPQLLIAAAWSLALGERHAEAERLIARITPLRRADAALDCECDLILGAGAIFADLPDRFAVLHDRWGTTPPLHDPVLLQVHANRSAYRELLGGRPAHACRHRQGAHLPAGFRPPAFLQRWNDGIVGLSYFWEGQVGLAEVILRPASVQSDVELWGAIPSRPCWRRCWRRRNGNRISARRRR